MRDRVEVAPVDTRAGLVVDHDPRLGLPDTGDDQPLLLPARERQRVLIGERQKIELVEQPVDVVVRWAGARRPRTGGGELDLGADAIGEELALHVLHDDSAYAEPLPSRDRLPVEANAAGMRLQSGNNTGEGGFACTVRTADRGHGPSGKVRRVNGEDRASLEHAAHVLKLETAAAASGFRGRSDGRTGRRRRNARPGRRDR